VANDTYSLLGDSLLLLFLLLGDLLSSLLLLVIYIFVSSLFVAVVRACLLLFVGFGVDLHFFSSLFTDLELGLDGDALEVSACEASRLEVGIRCFGQLEFVSEIFVRSVVLDGVCDPDEQKSSSLGMNLHVLGSEQRICFLHEDLLSSINVL
jgi:predicted neutral ceramidase superfamily lipid hydrolase